MPITFAHYLQRYRKQENLTQREVVDLLSLIPSLSKLDLTTFSRWERGTNKPILSKQLLVVRALGNDIGALIDPGSKVSLKQKIIFEHAKKNAHDPYQRKSVTFITNPCNQLIEYPELYEQLNTFHFQRLGVDFDIRDSDVEKLYVTSFTDQAGKMLGHILYGFVTTNIEERLLNPNTLKKCPFVELAEQADNNIDMYLISAYSSLAEPRMLIILMTLDILRKNYTIKNLRVNCHNQTFYDLYNSNLDCTITLKGERTSFGGVKVFGRCYQYVQLKLSAESILASTVISELVPFTDKHIQDLLEVR